ncbi:MAG: hypothetical protein AAGC88_03615 [Bacteroidota bacterium]
MIRGNCKWVPYGHNEEVEHYDAYFKELEYAGVYAWDPTSV